MATNEPTLLVLSRAIVKIVDFLPDNVCQDLLHECRETWHMAVLTAERFCNPTEKARPMLTSLYDELNRKREAYLTFSAKLLASEKK